jgi:GNAT superfamily N-acetyltransferase
VSRLVRVATVGDAATIGEIAVAAWRDTYTGLLRPATIDQFVASAYALEAVVRRIERDTFLVAEIDDGLRAFADAVERPDRVVLAALYAEPSWRGHGLGRLLLDEIRRRTPELPVAADVLVGNRLGEAFYERRGFVARERLEADLFGEPVVERRWWLGEPPPAGVTG